MLVHAQTHAEELCVVLIFPTVAQQKDFKSATMVGAQLAHELSEIAGLLDPTSGTITIGPQDVTRLPLSERAHLGLGYLPQERSVFRKLSARDNVAAMLETRGVEGHELRWRTSKLLAELALTEVADTRADQLSGGEQRRLEVARSLATNPRFLLFDEPFAGIDPLTIESLHAIFIGLRNAGVGILITDHNVRETLSLCDRAYVLSGGRVLAEGNASSLVANEAVRQRFLGDSFELVDAPAPS
jgi:lipopolysaccharide export system ATP-binding protein